MADAAPRNRESAPPPLEQRALDLRKRIEAGVKIGDAADVLRECSDVIERLADAWTAAREAAAGRAALPLAQLCDAIDAALTKRGH